MNIFQPKSLDDRLPKEHRELAKLLGIWSYDISAPMSLEDLALVEVRVKYGMKQEVKARTWTLEIMPESEGPKSRFFEGRTAYVIAEDNFLCFVHARRSIGGMTYWLLDYADAVDNTMTHEVLYPNHSEPLPRSM